MQQHPIPQNVINFQFKLVGDMTLKQFGYLAAGAVMAFLSIKLPYPTIIIYPVAGLLAFGGFALAFLPIEDRPLDVWLKNFFIAIFSPTQFIYKKVGGSLDFLNIDLTRTSATAEIVEKTLKQDRYMDYLKTLSGIDHTMVDKMEKHYMGSLDFALKKLVIPVSQNAATQVKPTPFPVKPKTSVNFQKSAIFSLTDIAIQPRIFENVKVRPLIQHVRGEIIVNKAVEQNGTEEDPKNPTSTNWPGTPMKQKTEEFQEVNLGTLTSPLKAQPTTTNVPSEKITAMQTSKTGTFDFQNLRKLNEEKMRQAEREKEKLQQVQIKEQWQKLKKRKTDSDKLLLPHEIDPRLMVEAEKMETKTPTPQTPKTPNIVCGVILSDGAPVAGAIVEIKNAENATQRTIKTNAIGQFTIATPLQNGEYTIYVEKEGMSFDIVRIVLDNKIINPIIIKAKENINV